MENLVTKLEANLNKQDELLKASESRSLSADEQKALETHKAEAAALERSINDSQALAKARKQLEETKRAMTEAPRAKVELSKSEKRDLAKFDMSAFLRAITNPQTRLDGINKEVIERGFAEATENKVEVRAGAYVLPSYIMGYQERDLTVTNSNEGGLTIATAKMDTVDFPVNKLVLEQMGARIMTGLTDNVDIPRIVAGTDAAFKAENASQDESSPTFANLSLTPKRLPTKVQVSSKLLKQKSAVDQLVVRNITAQLNAIFQKRIVNGAGTTEPLGILNTSGIGNQDIGTNGGALTWAAALAQVKAVGTSDLIDGDSLYYLTNWAVYAHARNILRTAGVAGYIIDDNDRIGAFQTKYTNSVPATLTKGTSNSICSALIFGDFSKLAVGFWSGVEVLVDPYVNADTGLVNIHFTLWGDGGVYMPAAFSKIGDITA
jgi:HK97 family phage major capsid protein